MSLHDHAWTPPPRPVVYSTHTPAWLRAWRAARPWVAFLLMVAFAVLCAATIITRLHVTDAQLERAHAQGMATGMTMCGGR